MVRSKIQQVKNNNSVQYRTTLPKQLIEALNGRKHDLLDWKVFDGKLIAEIISEGPRYNYTIYRDFIEKAEKRKSCI